MKKIEVKAIDHLVITTQNLDCCLAFYTGLLGMIHETRNGHHYLTFGASKISLHTRKGEFTPAATMPTTGSQDFCLLIRQDIHEVKQSIEDSGYPLATDIVERHGGAGRLLSIYLYDPDGNLVELSQPVSTRENIL